VTDSPHSAWPPLPLDGWRDTYMTLHMWTQIVGKVALALAPPLNHSWGVALQVASRGLSTRPLPYGSRTFVITFDFLDHELRIEVSDGVTASLALAPRSVADFYADVMQTLAAMNLGVRIWPIPVELPDPNPIRFDRDTIHASYDAEAVGRFWQIIVECERVFSTARCAFLGKASPVHFFWGGFDLAVSRFSGRLAPPREGPAFLREAYSREVISHGFWPGSGPVQEPAFYGYCVPPPAGFEQLAVRPAAAYYHRELGEYILPYEAVRTASSPAADLAAFIDSTYDGAATLAQWDRATLDRRSA